MPRFLLIALFLFSWTLLSPIAFAQNKHEHLYSVPGAQDFSRQIDSILALKDKFQKFEELFNDKTMDIKLYLQNTFSLPPQVAENYVNELGGDKMTLRDLFLKIGGDPKVLLEKMLIAKNDHPDHLNAYKYAENVRLKLLLNLKKDAVLEIFENYFKNEPLRNRTVMDLSLSKPYLKKENVDKIVAIKELAKKYDSSVNYYFSIPRKNLIADVTEDLSKMEKFRASGLITGLDITGSISETKPGVAPQIEDLEKVRENLKSILSYSGEKNIPLRIHAFEGANSGQFYDILKEELLAYKGPELKLRIGHIAKLNREWCETFKKIRPHVSTVIEASVSSNVYLNPGMTVDDIYKQIELAREFEIPVYIGSDGRGILEQASFSDQRDLLRKAAAEAAKNAKIPKYNPECLGPLKDLLIVPLGAQFVR